MWSFLSRYRDFGLLVLRIGIGAVFIWAYGWPLLIGGVEKWRNVGGAMKHVGIHFWPVVWGLMATMAETLGALLLAIGFLFRPACILLAFTMVIAMLFDHAKGGWREAAHAMEMAILFFSLIFIGPGKYSVDRD